MEKWFKIISAGLFVLLVIYIIYYIKNKKGVSLSLYNPVKSDSTTIKSNKAKLSSYKSSSSNFPLMDGSDNDDVKVLQSYLNSMYNLNLDVDGSIGDNTISAMKTYLGVTSVSQSQLMDYLNQATEYPSFKNILDDSSNLGILQTDAGTNK